MANINTTKSVEYALCAEALDNNQAACLVSYLDGKHIDYDVMRNVEDNTSCVEAWGMEDYQHKALVEYLKKRFHQSALALG